MLLLGRGDGEGLSNLNQVASMSKVKQLIWSRFRLRALLAGLEQHQKDPGD